MRDITYIVYDTDSFKILHVAAFYDKKMDCMLHEDNGGLYPSHIKKAGVNYINITHQKHRDILKHINDSNGTCYA